MWLYHWNARWHCRGLYLNVALFVIGITYRTFSFCDILFDSYDVDVTFADSWWCIIIFLVGFFFLLEDFWRYRHRCGAEISWGLQRFHRLFLLSLSLSWRIVNFLNVISHFGRFIELFSDNRIAIIVKYFLGFYCIWCSRYHWLSQSSRYLIVLFDFPLFHSFGNWAFRV